MKNKVMKNLIFTSIFAFALFGVISIASASTYYDSYDNSHYLHPAPMPTASYNYGNYSNNDSSSGSSVYNREVVNPYVSTSADKSNTNNTSSSKNNSNSSTSSKSSTSSSSKSVSSNDKDNDNLDSSSDPFDPDNLTALSLRGSGGFMPSSIWQWLFVIILITFIIILARLIGHTYAKNNHGNSH